MSDPALAPEHAASDVPADTAGTSVGREVLAAFTAIPARIEVSGHDPVWKINAASADAAMEYARRRWDDVWLLTTRTRRGLLGTRVTVTVTTDPNMVPPPAPLPEPEPAPVPEAPRPVSVEEALETSAPQPPPAASAAPAQTPPRTASVDPVDLLLAELDEEPAVAAAAPGLFADLLARYESTPAVPRTVAPAPPTTASNPPRSARRRELASLGDDAFVPAPVLPPAQASAVDGPWTRARLTDAGVSDTALRALNALPGAATMTWKEKVTTLVTQATKAAGEPDPRGGVAVIGYGPAGAAAVLTAYAEGVEVAGLRAERGARLLPATPSRVVKLLERALEDS